jgi:hypothetical protein
VDILRKGASEHHLADTAFPLEQKRVGYVIVVDHLDELSLDGVVCRYVAEFHAASTL